MKKKITYFILIMTLINLSALVTMLCLNRRAAGSLAGSGQKDRFEKVKRELDLTARQIDHFSAIRAEFHSRVDSLAGETEALRQQLLREIWQPQPQDAVFDTLLYQFSAVQMESQRLVIRHFFQFKHVLTPEQWREFYTVVSSSARCSNIGGASGVNRAGQ